MNTYKWMATWVTLLVAVTASVVQAQMDEPITRDERPQAQQPMDREAMMERCQQMMVHMRQMHDRMRQMDQQLKQQVQAMDRAQGEAKADAMADVIRTLVEQRRQMHERHGQMMQRMMRHMGEHMMMEGEEGQKQQMMMQCPMMQPPQEDNAPVQPGEAGHEAQP